MPGRWILDDDQSLYYLDDEEDARVNAECIQSKRRCHKPFRFPDHLNDVSGASGSQVNVADRKTNLMRRQSESADRLGDYRPEQRVELENRSEISALKRPRLLQRSAANLNRATVRDQTFVQPLSGLNLVMGYNTSLPKSRLDVYITVLRQMVRCSSERCVLSNELQRAVTAEGVLWTVREGWPAAEGYWNLTSTFRGFLHAELWRNFPCERSYRRLPPAYRPTRAQLAIPHSPMIDWMPWPDVRDMAIKYQDQIDIDALFRAAIHNLVAHRKKLGRRHRPSTAEQLPTDTSLVEDLSDKTSFRVWDLVCLEKVTGENPLSAEPCLEKKPVVRSPGVKALLRAYDLECDEFDTQKLDDGFFEEYPCCYADTATSAWKVKRFPGLAPVDVGRPVGLTRPGALRLKSKIESLVGAKFEI